METYDYLFKILITGDPSIGKSSLLLRYIDDAFPESYLSTIGVDFKIKNETIDNNKIKLQIWDTAGQERFRTITNSYYRNVNGIVIMYAIDNLKSFLDAKLWFEEVS